MGDFAKAFGGYTETSHGWVDNSDHNTGSRLPIKPNKVDDKAFGDDQIATVYLENGKFGLHGWCTACYNFTLTQQGDGFVLDLGWAGTHTVPSLNDHIHTFEQDGEPMVTINKSACDVLVNFYQTTLQKGLFAGATIRSVHNFLQRSCMSSDDLHMGVDLQGDGYLAHQTHILNTQKGVYVDLGDFLALVIYNDPIKALEKGNHWVRSQAERLQRAWFDLG